MARHTLTPTRAREIILYAAGLSRKAQFGKGKEAVYKFIDHLGFVQVDTNYVVERAHHHAIATRVRDYRPEWLEQLQQEGRIFEFWTFASGFIPMREFRFSLPVKQAFLARRQELTSTEVNLMRKIMDRISREGPLMARHFENDRITKSTGWWDWRPSKVALERLHLDGRLITTRTGNFQKLYDLSENVIPRDIDMTPPSLDEFSRHMILRCLKAWGVAYAKEICWSARFVKHNIKALLKTMVDTGDVLEVEIKDLKSGPLYMHPDYLKKKITLSGEVFILTPFDTLNVFRHRLRDFFNFDYQVECFVPEKKRKYGYFSLPILAGDTFVGRMDSKADRKNRVLIINNIHFEDLTINHTTQKKVKEAIRWFAEFNGCDSVVVKKTNVKWVK